jgi:hypothetical protein
MTFVADRLLGLGEQWKPVSKTITDFLLIFAPAHSGVLVPIVQLSL